MLFVLLQWTLGSTARGCDRGGRSAAQAAMDTMPQHATHHGGGDHGACGDHAGMTTDAQCAMAVGCATGGALAPTLVTGARPVTAHVTPSSLSGAPSSWQARPQVPPPKA